MKTKMLALLSLLSLTACGTPQTPLPVSPALRAPIPAQNSTQFQAESVASRTVSNLAYKILSKYDHNLSRQIEYRETNTFWKSLIGRNENERRQTRYSSARKEWSFSVWKYSKLFLAADDNNDGVTSLEEIEAFISAAYDKDKDGILQTRGWWRFWREPEEWEYFKREMGEDYETHRVPMNFSPPTGSEAEAAAAEASQQIDAEPMFLDPDAQNPASVELESQRRR